MDKRYLSLIVGLLVIMFLSSSAFGWLSSFDNRKPITIDSMGLCDSNLTDFVFTINGTYSDLTKVKSNGFDIAITNDTDVQLSHDLAYFNNATGQIEIHFKSDCDSTHNQTFYIYYGDADAADQSDASNVYDSDVIAVYHNNDTTTSTITDSKNGYTGTKISTGNPTENTQDGKLALAQDYDGTNDYIAYPSTQSLLGQAEATVSQWVYLRTHAEAEYDGIYVDKWIGGFTRFGIYVKSGSTAIYSDASGSISASITTTNTLSYHTWYLITARFDYPGNFKIFVNGEEWGTTTTTAAIGSTAHDFINTGAQNGATGDIDAIMDELHVEKVARSNNWINASYKIQSSDAFYSVGAEEIDNTAPTITITSPTNTTYYTTTINLTVQANDTDSASFSCNVTNDGSLLTTLTDDSTYTINLTKTGGDHNITVSCEDSDNDTSTETVYYYVWMGLNISTYYSDTGNLSDNWDIYITNGTDNYSSLSNNGTVLFEWNTIPTGDINITVNETNATLYYMNATTNTTINNSLFLPLNITLTAKIDNPMTITSSSGQSLISGQTTTISCTVSEGTPTMSINNVYLSNPYILTVSQGLYNIECDIGETNNYRPTTETETLTVNALIACTTNSTFAFEKNISTSTNLTTIDMTSAVTQNLIKSDLSDIYVNNVSDTWKNISNGNYYIVVNNTGLSTINLKFGNYFVNNSWDNHQVEGTPINISEYTQINPYQIFNLLDELTGEYLSPPNATLMTIAHCSSGDSYINIADNDTKFLLATSEYIDKAAIRITYTADAYYSRQLYPVTSDALVLHFYLADAFINAIDRIDFIMQDQTFYGSKFQVYKTISGEAMIITEGYFDVSHQFSTYLMEDLDYFLQTNDNGTIGDFGRITIVAPETKYIGDVQMITNPETLLLAENIVSNTWTDENYTTLYFYYTDKLNQTINLTITAYFENGSIFNQYFSSGINTVSINYNISDYSNQSFYVTYKAWHETFGNSPVEWLHNVFNPITVDLGINTFWYPIFSLIILMIVGMTTTREAFIGGSVLFFISMILLVSIDWLTMSWATIGFIGFLIVLGISNYFHQGGE